VRAGAGLDGERVRLSLDRPGVRNRQSLLMSRHSLSPGAAPPGARPEVQFGHPDVARRDGTGTSSPVRLDGDVLDVDGSADRSTEMTSASRAGASPRSTSTVSPALTRVPLAVLLTEVVGEGGVT